MKKKEVQKISEVVSEFLKNDTRLQKGLVQSRVVQNWRVVMGPTVDRCTKNVFISSGGVLFVTLNSSVVRSELLMLKDKIIKSLNQSVGVDVVSDIVFK